jgi:uncharacterized protein (DUF362 family)
MVQVANFTRGGEVFYRSQHPKCESHSQLKLPILVKNQVGISLNVARVDHRRALANDSFWRKAAGRMMGVH